MEFPLSSVTDLGLIVRAVRRESGIRLDDLAGTAGVSKQFTSDVEHGKSTVQLGLVFKLLAELGIGLQADVPAAAIAEYNKLKERGGLPLPKKRSPKRNTARPSKAPPR